MLERRLTPFANIWQRNERRRSHVVSGMECYRYRGLCAGSADMEHVVSDLHSTVKHEFAFCPGNWVVISFCDVNYRGRVSSCKWIEGKNVYEIEYVNDVK